MNADLATEIRNRLQVCSLALESIEETTDRAIVMQRIQNAVKHIQQIKQLLVIATVKPDVNGHLGTPGEVDLIAELIEAIRDVLPDIPHEHALCHVGLTTQDKCVYCTRIRRAHEAITKVRNGDPNGQ